MAKFSGVIGFTTSVETVPGVWDDEIVERHYRGDILRNNRKWQFWREGEKVNDNFEIDNQISVLSDTYLYQNIPSIKYILWLGVKWKVSSVDINRPRVIITIGDVYNAA